MTKALGKELKSKILSYSAKDKKQWIENLLSLLKTLKSADDIHHQVLSESRYEGLKGFMPDIRRYPRLRFKLSLDESRLLKEQVVNNHSSLLDACLASGMTKNGTKLTPLEKLLYAFLWKQGELGKFQLFLKGLTNCPIRSQDRIVLFEFAKYLTGENNYILDQHTLRCFALAFAEDQVSMEKALKLETITGNKLVSCIQSYKIFFDELNSCLGESQGKEDFLYEVDRVLFAAGKCLKIFKKQ